MALFRPRIRKQREQPPEALINQDVKQQPGIIGKDSDIVQAICVGVRYQAGNAGEIRLGADDADIRVGPTLRHQVFTVAEADLEPNIRHPGAKKLARIKAIRCGVPKVNGEFGQKPVEYRLPGWPRRLSAPAAI